MEIVRYISGSINGPVRISQGLVVSKGRTALAGELQYYRRAATVISIAHQKYKPRAYYDRPNDCLS